MPNTKNTKPVCVRPNKKAEFYQEPYQNPVLVVLLHDRELYLQMTGALHGSESTAATYGGTLLGQCFHVKVIEGCWNQTKSVALMSFQSYFGARMFFYSDPVLKQWDAVGEIDIWIFPMSQMERFRQGYPVFHIQSRCLTFKHVFHAINQAKVKSLTGGFGGLFGVVDTDLGESLRGVLQPAYVMLHQWPKMEDLVAFLNSSEYENINEMYKQVGKGFNIAGKLEIVKK